MEILRYLCFGKTGECVPLIVVDKHVVKVALREIRLDAVDLLQGFVIVERYLIGRDAHDRTIALVKFIDQGGAAAFEFVIHDP